MKSYNLKMDLQLFADPSASLQNTTGTMTNEMKTFYEKRLIDQAEPRLVHDQFADYYPGRPAAPWRSVPPSCSLPPLQLPAHMHRGSFSGF